MRPAQSLDEYLIAISIMSYPLLFEDFRPAIGACGELNTIVTTTGSSRRTWGNTWGVTAQSRSGPRTSTAWLPTEYGSRGSSPPHLPT
jgi:hypothetical protein